MSNTKYVENIKDICSFYKDNKEIFNQSIELFSTFMTLTNENYAYNKTYLESYTKELNDLSEKFISRDEFVQDVFKKIGIKLIKTADVNIVIDNIWILNSTGIHYNKDLKGNCILKNYIIAEFKKEDKIFEIRKFYNLTTQLDDTINFLEECLKDEGK